MSSTDVFGWAGTAFLLGIMPGILVYAWSDR